MSAADCQFCLNFYPAFCLDLCSVSWTVYTLALTPHFPPIIHSLQQCWRTCWQVKNEKRRKNFIVWRKFVFDRQHFHISELFLSLTRSLYTDGVQIKLDGVNQIQGYHGACARSQYAASAALGVLPQAWCQDRCCSISSPLCPPPTPLLSVRGRHPETHTELKVTHLQHYHCTPLHQCSRIALGCGFCVSMNLIILIGTLILSLSSPDLPASSLQYQCGSVDYLCSPRLVKKGPTPRPCHDRPAIKPRPQPSASPRPPTAQKPQGKIPWHSLAPSRHVLASGLSL